MSFTQAQSLESLELAVSNGLRVKSYKIKNEQPVNFSSAFPFFSIELNDTLTTSLSCKALINDGEYDFRYPDGLTREIKIFEK